MKPTGKVNLISSLVCKNKKVLVCNKDTELSDHRMITVKSSFNCKQNVVPKIVFEPFREVLCLT